MNDLKTAAIEALEAWHSGHYPAQPQFVDVEMVRHYNAILQRFGEAFVTEREDNTPNEYALRKVLRWAMSSALTGSNTLPRAFQIRVSDLPQHLAENAALHHIIRTVAPAVMDQDEALSIGIERASRF